MIKFDRSWNSIVVECTSCPHWRALALDQIEAYKAGERHAMRVHDVDPHDAETARRMYETREAARANRGRHAADT